MSFETAVSIGRFKSKTTTKGRIFLSH